MVGSWWWGWGEQQKWIEQWWGGDKMQTKREDFYLNPAKDGNLGEEASK